MVPEGEDALSGLGRGYDPSAVTWGSTEPGQLIFCFHSMIFVANISDF